MHKQAQKVWDEFIENYVENYGMALTQKRVEALQKTFRRLVMFPEMGSIVRTNGTIYEYRAIRMFNYLKFIYFVSGLQINIVDIWIKKQDEERLKKRLK